MFYEYEKKTEIIKMTQNLTDNEFRLLFTALLHQPVTQDLTIISEKTNPCYIAELLNDTVFCSECFDDIDK